MSQTLVLVACYSRQSYIHLHKIFWNCFTSRFPWDNTAVAVCLVAVVYYGWYVVNCFVGPCRLCSTTFSRRVFFSVRVCVFVVFLSVQERLKVVLDGWIVFVAVCWGALFSDKRYIEALASLSYLLASLLSIFDGIVQ